MKWKKKLQQPQYALNSEKVFLTATQPAKIRLLIPANDKARVDKSRS